MKIHTRRDVFKFGAAFAATATPALAYQTPVTETPTLDLTTGEKVQHHAREIERLLKADLPEGALLKGFEFRCNDDGIEPGTIWASGMTPDFNLCHARPDMYDGWRVTTLKIAGVA